MEKIIGALVTAAIVYLLTRKPWIAAAAGGADLFLKLGWYLVYEKLWLRIPIGKRALKPSVVWLTGYSGAGKTTLAQAFCHKMHKMGLPVEHLDGDSIRALFPQTGFTRDARNEHVKRVGFLASKLERNGIFVIVSLISPYQESRDFARSLCRNFIEVHVATPFEECERRDPKGLYQKARKGEIKNFTGVDDPYEPPMRPELVLDLSKLSTDKAVHLILKKMKVRVG